MDDELSSKALLCPPAVRIQIDAGVVDNFVEKFELVFIF
jgi:hypothetical protein